MTFGLRFAFILQQPFTCDCLNGFVGALCENKDMCAPNPCLNGGTCSLLGKACVNFFSVFCIFPSLDFFHYLNVRIL